MSSTTAHLIAPPTTSALDEETARAELYARAHTAIDTGAVTEAEPGVPDGLVGERERQVVGDDPQPLRHHRGGRSADAEQEGRETRCRLLI